MSLELSIALTRLLATVTAAAALCVACSGAGARSAASPFVLPVQATCVSSPFGVRHMPSHPELAPFHNGIDLPAPVGSPVLAVGPGTVIRVQRKGLGGLEMLVQHDGFIGVYSHLGMVAPTIAEGGRTVYGGEKIGTVGMTGMTFGPHLFFAMIVGDRPIDPAQLLGVMPCGQKLELGRPTLLPPTRAYFAARATQIRPGLALSAR